MKDSGEPLEGVKIAVGIPPSISRTGYTDSNGYYELIWDKPVGINIPGTITKDDYKFLINDPWQFARMGPNSFRVTLNIIQPEVEYNFEAYIGKSKDATPTLDNNGRIYGYVRERSSNKPIEGAKVHIYALPDQLHHTFYTDSTGFYEYTDLPIGTHYYIELYIKDIKRQVKHIILTERDPEYECNFLATKSKLLNMPFFLLFNNPLLSRFLEKTNLFSPVKQPW
jgi:hypothetical protein